MIFHIFSIKFHNFCDFSIKFHDFCGLWALAGLCGDLLGRGVREPGVEVVEDLVEGVVPVALGVGGDVHGVLRDSHLERPRRVRRSRQTELLPSGAGRFSTSAEIIAEEKCLGFCAPLHRSPRSPQRRSGGGNPSQSRGCRSVRRTSSRTAPAREVREQDAELGIASTGEIASLLRYERAPLHEIGLQTLRRHLLTFCRQSPRLLKAPA